MTGTAVSDTFFCGPLEVIVAGFPSALRAKVADSLTLNNVSWEAPHLRVDLTLAAAHPPAAMVAGTLLVCGRMHVDSSERGLYATSRSGSSCWFDASNHRWTIAVPPTANGAVPYDVEDLVGLVLTTSWRQLGWAPMHAGAVVRDGRCALLCAPSGGGKTTLTAALIRSGWRALGDDKLLLRLTSAGLPHAAALVHTLNLHPHARRWFPEVGDLSTVPRYSAETEKRKVRIETIWPKGTVRSGQPTHFVQIVRDPARRGSRVLPLSAHEVLDGLLRQTVIPSDRRIAAQILDIVVPTARRLRGVRFELGEDVYHEPAALSALAAALQ
jgi:hypothetical protein